MKKITIICCLAALTFGASAQTETKRTNSKGEAVTSYSISKLGDLKTNSAYKHGGNPSTMTTIYSQDFATGVPAGWAITDSSGGGKIWTYDTDGPSGPSAPAAGADNLLSTTFSNGIMIMDDDLYGQGTGATETELISDAINCSTNTVVKIRFQDFYRHYDPAASQGILLVSNDSINWTDVYHVETGLISGAATTNPHYVDVNISAVAASQATVYLKFLYRGDWGYYWELDDIEVYEPSATDGSVIGLTLPFNSCALGAAESIEVSILNVGTSVLSNIPVAYSVDGGTPVMETVAGPINGGDTLSYTFTQTADLSTSGLHSIQSYTQITGDGNSSNDSSTSVTASYAPIDVSAAPYNMGFEPTDDYSGFTVYDVDGDGTTFDIPTALTHTGVGCIRKPGSGGPDDNWFFTTCFALNAGTNYLLDFWYKEFDIPTACGLEVYIGNQNNVAAATQNIVVCPIPADTTYQHSTNSFTVATTGTYYFGFRFVSTAATGTSSLRVDDILVDLSTGINDNSGALSTVKFFPNPSNGLVNISGLNEAAIVTVSNQVGQVIMVKNLTNLGNQVLDLNNQPTGLYHIQVKSGNDIINQTININR
ncbi:MAG: choice-of-anchor J domain-containing protein [Bacteroidia bacterium]